MAKLKSFIVNFILKVFSLLPMKKVIIFESSPDFACNTYPVYEALRSHDKIKGKWRLMWFVSDEKFVPDDFPREDILYLEPSGIKENLKHLYYRATAAAIVMCNRVKNPVSKRQLTVFLCHGSNAKRIRGLYEIGQKIDHVLCQAHFFDNVICYESNVRPEQLFYTGYPRCDVLLHDRREGRRALDIPDSAKLIMWLPTYRKHKNQTMEQEGSAGIPLVKSPEALKEISSVLEKNNAYAVLKPHPSECLSAFQSCDTDRFRIITDDFLAENKLRLYELLSGADALITDYSSVLYDFLLCDRPIAVTTDDAESYKNSRGFAFDVVGLFSKAATELPDLPSLFRFVEELNLGIDNKKEGRAHVRDLTSMYQDDRSAERTAEFIIEKIKA